MHQFATKSSQEFGKLPWHLLKGDNTFFLKALEAKFVLNTDELVWIYYQMLLDCLYPGAF